MSAVARLAGKVAIVTASSDGIGFAIAKRLAEDGAKVMVSSRKAARVDEAVSSLTSKSLNVAGTVCHVAKPEDRKKLVEETLAKFGGLDILVNNAGINPAFGPVLDTSEDVWDKVFETNVKAPFLFCKDVAPLMEKRGGGSIIFVSSILGYHPETLLGCYSVSKTALLGLVKVLVPQLNAMNIRVNSIAPGLIDTKFSAMLKSDESILARIPMNRFGTPEECANVVSFLVSEEASYITGETFKVTGGMMSSL
ncbi:dehydrogenase/reductase SDR family member 4 isoform X2 [Octopus bimaculoides]|uniref:Dehydrogenase/reductase SDR family member 4 n=1 Tax=Octopus bimaculoides TaxID=37653 RepID=A0A0L8GWJ3_OCTBM|nr:dehydrogenase/reductase SDR family member 4 isoform X2 [Octopus bimaculoides]|eukprot:XP_014777568.1 PREDICTED: dehydrogenase/reductase SDR family member 4-like isoform X2 [Octopus bimaculoides]